MTKGEAWRTPQQAAWNAANGKGIRASLHVLRLAEDANLFIDGVYQTESPAYAVLGEYWEALGREHGFPCRWGGRFKRPDGNHFSIEHNGIQ